MCLAFNPIALRKVKIVYNFGLSEAVGLNPLSCNRGLGMGEQGGEKDKDVLSKIS